VTSRRAALFLLLPCLAIFAKSQDAPQTPDRGPDDTMQNLLIKKVNPLYPPLARQARIQDTVIVKIVINKFGNVQSLELLKGHPSAGAGRIRGCQAVEVSTLPIERRGKGSRNQRTGEFYSRAETRVQVNCRPRRVGLLLARTDSASLSNRPPPASVPLPLPSCIESCARRMQSYVEAVLWEQAKPRMRTT
jgi:Gram-negative bacterial TonB protein C-terminal